MATSTLLIRATGSAPLPRGGRGRASRSVVAPLTLLAATALMAVTTAAAQDPSASRPPLERPPAAVRAGSPARIGGAPSAPCVQVDIAGHRAGHLDCAGQALQEAGRLAQAQARSAIDTPVLQAGSPDVAVGVSSLSGSRLRMGDALGHSVHPRRPNRAPSAPRPAAPDPGGRP